MRKWWRTKCCYCDKPIEVCIPIGTVLRNKRVLQSNACYQCVPETSMARNGLDESAWKVRIPKRKLVARKLNGKDEQGSYKTTDLHIRMIMPDKNDVSVCSIKMRDHSEILERIPDYFYTVFLSELFAIEGPVLISGADEYGLNSGTYGWYIALKSACDRLDMPWLVEYWDELQWYESDAFDSELELRMTKLLHNWPNSSDSSYFKILVKKFPDSDKG